jgi:hypothetical protein
LLDGTIESEIGCGIKDVGYYGAKLAPMGLSPSNWCHATPPLVGRLVGRGHGWTIRAYCAWRFAR